MASTQCSRHLLFGMSAALALVTGACAEDEPQSGAGSAFQTLAVQLENCGDSALTCLQAANCDDAAEQVCRDGFRTCRENTRAAYQAFHEAVHACWQQKRECRAAQADAAPVADGGGGDTCREQLRACIDAERPMRPEPGPCMSALRECVQTNVMWGQDGSRAAFRDCLGQAHECIVNRLPMCGPDEPDDDADAGAEDGMGRGAEGDFGSRRGGGWGGEHRR